MQKEYIASQATCYEKAKYAYVLDDWLFIKRIKVKDSTYIRYRNSIENHIKPQLGKYPVDKISTSRMESFVTELIENGKLNSEGGLSTKTVSDILVIIKESFAYARNSILAFREERICNI